MEIGMCFNTTPCFHHCCLIYDDENVACVELDAYQLVTNTFYPYLDNPHHFDYMHLYFQSQNFFQGMSLTKQVEEQMRRKELHSSFLTGLKRVEIRNCNPNSFPCQNDCTLVFNDGSFQEITLNAWELVTDRYWPHIVNKKHLYYMYDVLMNASFCGSILQRKKSHLFLTKVLF